MVGNPRLRDANYKPQVDDPDRQLLLVIGNYREKLTIRDRQLVIGSRKYEPESLGWDLGCGGTQLQSKVGDPGWFGSQTSCCNGFPKNSEPSSPWNPPYS